MPDHPDLLTVTAHPHADSDPLDRGARMTLGDLLELRVGAALDLHQPVMTAHRDPPRGDVHALFDLLAARRVDDVTERDPGHRRAADLHRPGGGRRPVKASVRGARVVGSPARDRVLADPGDRDPSSARWIPVRGGVIDRARDPPHTRRPRSPRRCDELGARRRRRIRRTRQRHGRQRVIDVERLGVAHGKAGRVPSAQRQLARAIGELRRVDRLQHRRRAALMPDRLVLSRGGAGHGLTVDRGDHAAHARRGVTPEMKTPVATDPARRLPQPDPARGAPARPSPERTGRPRQRRSPRRSRLARACSADQLKTEVARPQRSKPCARLAVVRLGAPAGPVEATPVPLAVVHAGGKPSTPLGIEAPTIISPAGAFACQAVRCPALTVLPGAPDLHAVRRRAQDLGRSGRVRCRGRRQEPKDAVAEWAASSDRLVCGGTTREIEPDRENRDQRRDERPGPGPGRMVLGKHELSLGHSNHQDPGQMTATSTGTMA